MVKKLWIIFIIALIVSLLLEFGIQREVVFGVDGTPFFDAWFGFLSCAVIIVVSKILGIFLKRKVNYYKEVRHDE